MRTSKGLVDGLVDRVSIIDSLEEVVSFPAHIPLWDGRATASKKDPHYGAARANARPWRGSLESGSPNMSTRWLVTFSACDDFPLPM
jgi:hypothetical protein